MRAQKAFTCPDHGKGNFIDLKGCQKKRYGFLLRFFLGKVWYSMTWSTVPRLHHSKISGFQYILLYYYIKPLSQDFREPAVSKNEEAGFVGHQRHQNQRFRSRYEQHESKGECSAQLSSWDKTWTNIRRGNKRKSLVDNTLSYQDPCSCISIQKLPQLWSIWIFICWWDSEKQFL